MLGSKILLPLTYDTNCYASDKAIAVLKHSHLTIKLSYEDLA